MSETPDITFSGLRKKALDAQSDHDLLFVSALAQIQIAQEANEIKHILAGREQQEVITWLKNQQDALLNWMPMAAFERQAVKRVIDELITRWEAEK